MVVFPEQIKLTERQLEEHWFIAGLVLTSMACQILLLLTGGNRKWMQLLQSVAWLAYTGADAVASYCLGAMSHLSQVLSIHSVWAAMLLMHLGGVDNISAYSPEDAELWGRHGLLMAQQVLTAFYILGRTARGVFAGVSFPLMLVGSFKYMEKTWALRWASAESLARQVRLMSSYRSTDREQLMTGSMIPLEQIDNSADCSSNPLNISSCPITSSISSSSRTPTVAAAGSTCTDVSQDQTQTQSPRVRQNEQWRQFDYELVVSDRVSLYGRRMKVSKVTLGEVLCCAELSKMSHLMTLCKAFALFKLYRRRILRLSMPESGGETMRLFLRKLVEEKSLGDVLEVELRFLFDSVYTKAAGTAFTAWGLLLRMVSVCLLFFAAMSVFLVLHFDAQEDGPGFKAVTAWLFVGGSVIDVYQLCRWMMSDWTRVRLACTYVEMKASLAAVVVDRQNLVTSNQTRGGSRSRILRLPYYKFVHAMRRCCAWFTLTLLNLLESGLFTRNSYWVKDIGRSCVFTAGSMDAGVSTNKSVFRRATGFIISKVWHVLRGLKEVWGKWAREAQVFIRIVVCGRLWAPTAPNYTSAGQRDVDMMRRDLINDVFRVCEERLDRSAGVSRTSVFRSDLSGLRSQLTGVAGACLPLLQEMGLDRRLGWSVVSDWEHSVLVWHVATFLYRKASIVSIAIAAGGGSGAYDNVSAAADHGGVNMTKRCALCMSEYMAYLLQKRTELLPCHPYVGREMVWAQTVKEAAQLGFGVAARSVDEVRQWINQKKESLQSMGNLNVRHLMNSPLDGGAVLAWQLLLIEQERASQDDAPGAVPASQPPPTAAAASMGDRHLQHGVDMDGVWRILYDVWREILLVTAAANNRPMAHVEQLASGAELLTLIWVLLGHTLG